MEPRRVGTFVSKWISSLQRGPTARIQKAWDERIDVSLSSRARPVKWQSGTLWVEVDSSAALEEMSTYRREAILSSLASEGVRNIRFVVGRRR